MIRHILSTSAGGAQRGKEPEDASVVIMPYPVGMGDAPDGGGDVDDVHGVPGIPVITGGTDVTNAGANPDDGRKDVDVAVDGGTVDVVAVAL